MERIMNKARGFKAAAQWDVEQQRQMTPRERREAALRLRRRVYGAHSKDVRECHKTE